MNYDDELKPLSERVRPCAPWLIDAIVALESRLQAAEAQDVQANARVAELDEENRDLTAKLAQAESRARVNSLKMEY